MKTHQDIDSRWMTVQEVALYLSLHPMTVYSLLRQKKIPSIKLGGSWRIHQAQLDQWLMRQTEKVLK